MSGGVIGAIFLFFWWGRLSSGIILERKWWGWRFFAVKNWVGTSVGRGTSRRGENNLEKKWWGDSAQRPEPIISVRCTALNSLYLMLGSSSETSAGGSQIAFPSSIKRLMNLTYVVH